ncbi:hypothetical protein [Conexibacter woesei]|uniref:hypothetical protein n=1 Tax=Conexibacter woesei TaxID=191495 RepID=UPI000404AED4|nr:hypothetical protein [Conexibacter woesei]
MKTKTTILLLTAALLALPTVATASPASSGAAWLATAQKPGADGMSADALVALRAGGRLTPAAARTRANALRAGANRYAATAGGTAKTILALVAARSGSARCAPGVDLLVRLQRQGHDGRYGTTIYDQAYGMLAIRALHAGPSARTIKVLKNARGAGGWNFELTRSGGHADDATATALAILALRAAGVPKSDGGLKAGLRWLRTQRTPAGGFALGRRDRNEANSTALAIEAARAMGSKDTRATSALKSLQRPGGAFQFTRDDAGSRVLATNDAVVALSGHVLPVISLRSTPKAC